MKPAASTKARKPESQKGKNRLMNHTRSFTGASLKGPSPAGEKEIPRLIEQLATALHEQEQLTKDLGSRLQPVLTAAPPDCKAGAAATMPKFGLTALGSAIGERIECVYANNGLLRSLLERLEL